MSSPSVKTLRSFYGQSSRLSAKQKCCTLTRRSFKPDISILAEDMNLCKAQGFRRPFSTSRQFSLPPSAPPKTKDRGPPSKEDTQTDFNTMDILSNTPAPTTGIDATQTDGFALNSGLKVVGSGVLLVGGEAFKWSPWIKKGRKEGTIGDGARGNDNKGVMTLGGKLLNNKGQWDVDAAAWGVLSLVWPKPDLLILGTGPSIAPVSPATRKAINELGIRLEVQDTRNAAAQFNLLATERGVQQVAAALIPTGWREGS